MKEFHFKNLSQESLGIKAQTLPNLETYLESLPKETASKFTHAPKIINALRSFKYDLAKSPAESEEPQTLKKHGRVLIAGGFTRDLLLNITPEDLDFATDLTHEEIESALKQNFKPKEYSLVYKGQNFAVCHLTIHTTGHSEEEHYEIATFRQDISSTGRHAEVVHSRLAGLDAQRRDLTINGLFYNPTNGHVIDYVGGLEDLKNRSLKFIGSPSERIQEDKLRALRFIRFHFKTGFKMDKEALTFIQNNAESILGSKPFPDSKTQDSEKLSTERVIEEFTKTLELAAKNNQAGEVLRIYEKLNLLDKFLPEIAELRKCEQGPPYHTEGDVLEHTILVLNNLPKNASPQLLLASIFHDTAKPQSRAETTKGGKLHVSFHGHAEQGVETTLNRLKSLKITTLSSGKNSSQKISPEAIANLVKYHIFFFELGKPNKPKKSKILKILNEVDPDELSALGRADTLGSIPDSEEIKNNNLKILAEAEKYLGIIAEEIRSESKDPKLTDLIKELANGNTLASIYEQIHSKKLQGSNIGKLKTLVIDAIHDHPTKNPEELKNLREKIIADFT